MTSAAMADVAAFYARRTKEITTKIRPRRVIERNVMSPLIRARLEAVPEAKAVYSLEERRGYFIEDAKRRVYERGIPHLQYRTGRKHMRALSKADFMAEYYEPTEFMFDQRAHLGAEGMRRERKFRTMQQNMMQGSYAPGTRKGMGKKQQMQQKKKK